MINFYLSIVLLLSSCSSTVFSESQYSRKEWKHWIDEDKNCLNTRHEILKARSKEPVVMNTKECKVVKGKWDDYYYNEELLKVSQVDIDHLVPLKHAHDHGGAKWSRQKKKIYANDPQNLVITNKKYNRLKGSKSPAQWLPLEIKYACRYYRDWMKIKKKYQLTITQEELKAIDIEKCTKVTF